MNTNETQRESLPIIMETKPLFVVTSRRVYRPDETPPAVQEKACEREGIDLDPCILTDRMRDSFEDELEAHGLSYRTSGRDSRGPFWTLDCLGAGVGVALNCDDVAKYVAARKIEHDAELLRRIIDSGNGPDLRTTAAGRDGCRTTAESDYCLDEPAEIALAQKICDDFSDYVRGLAQRMHKDLETDRDYLTSWECVKESAECNECGFDDSGAMVPLSDCREGEKGETAQ